VEPSIPDRMWFANSTANALSTEEQEERLASHRNRTKKVSFFATELGKRRGKALHRFRQNRDLPHLVREIDFLSRSKAAQICTALLQIR
jgi:hypothetical protein